jgi:glycerate kinase
LQSLKQLSLSGLIEQSPLLGGVGIGVAAVAKALYSPLVVAAGYLATQPGL